MSIWNKVLLGLVIFTALVFSYLGMRTLKTHQYWCELTKKIEKKEAEVAAQNELLVEGSPEGAAEPVRGIKQYRAEINNLVSLRGRMWSNCEPKNANPQTGQVTVAPDRPAPHLIRDSNVLYVFDENDAAKGGRYLGKFIVTAVAETTVALAPLEPMNERELAQLAKSKGPWVMYEKMPADNHWAMAELSEADKKALLPKDVVGEYLHDGEKATWETIDNEWKVPGELVDEFGKRLRDADGKKLADAKGLYERPLRDYDVIFTDAKLERTMMAHLFASLQANTARLAEAAAEVKAQITSRKAQVADMTEAKGKIETERAALLAHEKALKRRIGEFTTMVNTLLASNRAQAAEIAKAQLEAAKRIDARSPSMAQSTESGK